MGGEPKQEDPTPNLNLNSGSNTGHEPPSAAASFESEKEESMAIDPASLVANPSWFTPKRMLCIFFVVKLNRLHGSQCYCKYRFKRKPQNLLQKSEVAYAHLVVENKTKRRVYFLIYNLHSGDFDLSNFENGVISSALMVGLLVASPIFIFSQEFVNPFRLIVAGLSLWTFVVAFCGFSFNFYSIAISRIGCWYLRDSSTSYEIYSIDKLREEWLQYIDSE
ncbi:hypothetical protein CASFOL_022635 [Castilleja foliolosa]|uniref:Uncharacterized protein n=1 Tax=Castilleja foliolosa TaxID=1961234 RepID=A0ABD3CW13_9LAMI